MSKIENSSHIYICISKLSRIKLNIIILEDISPTVDHIYFIQAHIYLQLNFAECFVNKQNRAVMKTKYDLNSLGLI